MKFFCSQKKKDRRIYSVIWVAKTACIYQATQISSNLPNDSKVDLSIFDPDCQYWGQNLCFQNTMHKHFKHWIDQHFNTLKLKSCRLLINSYSLRTVGHRSFIRCPYMVLFITRRFFVPKRKEKKWCSHNLHNAPGTSLKF